MPEKDHLSDVQEHEAYLEAEDSTQIFMRSWFPQQEVGWVQQSVDGEDVGKNLHKRPRWGSGRPDTKPLCGLL